jgi:hypothetical protein
MLESFGCSSRIAAQALAFSVGIPFVAQSPETENELAKSFGSPPKGFARRTSTAHPLVDFFLASKVVDTAPNVNARLTSRATRPGPRPNRFAPALHIESHRPFSHLLGKLGTGLPRASGAARVVALRPKHKHRKRSR